jgi:D-alanyl-D-alanine carboxypeptidase/D-alanyl-D-alanine-endopeptidase (penicillin-binding protein 4)
MNFNNLEDSSSIERAKQKVKVGSPRVVFTLLGTLTLLIGGALGVAWKTVDNIADSVTAEIEVREIAALSSSVISARRAPGTLSNEVRIGSLRRSLVRLERLVNNESCLIVDVEGQQIAALRPNLPVIPASTMKVLVASVALEILGPDFVYQTKLQGIQEGSTISGDLYLVGGGDPLLFSAQYPTLEPLPTFNGTSIESLADVLVAAGVRSISGSVIGDESRYDNERFTPTLGLGIRTTEVGPLGSLMINDGVVTGNPIKPDNPALAAAQEFTNILNAKGISVSGAASVGVASADVPVVAEISSRPLPDVLAEMLTNSDNNTAELVLKEIGLSVLQQGTRLAGAQAMIATLTEMGIPTEGLVINDGSGLDRGNRVTCSTIQSLLLRDGGFGSLGTGLAIAGRTGTLGDLFTEGTVTQRLRGKTGTLTGVKGLAGYVTYDAELASTFTLILNGSGVSNQSTYRPIWSALAEALARFSSSPSAAQISPNP